MGIYQSTKTYNTDQGLSCCFRQWRATHSHCSKLHGYSIGVKLVFESTSLDERNWVMDFGGLKEFKQWLTDTFDHKLLVASDDPKIEQIKALTMADVVVVPAVGCEKFAEMAYKKMSKILSKHKDDGTALNPTVILKSVEVFEHGANSAVFIGTDKDRLACQMAVMKG